MSERTLASSVFGGVGIEFSSPPVLTQAASEPRNTHDRASVQKVAFERDNSSPYTSHPRHQPPQGPKYRTHVEPPTGLGRYTSGGRHQPAPKTRHETVSSQVFEQGMLAGGGPSSPPPDNMRSVSEMRSSRNRPEPRDGAVRQTQSSIVFGGATPRRDHTPSSNSNTPQTSVAFGLGEKSPSVSAPATWDQTMTSQWEGPSCPVSGIGVLEDNGAPSTYTTTNSVFDRLSQSTRSSESKRVTKYCRQSMAVDRRRDVEPQERSATACPTKRHSIALQERRAREAMTTEEAHHRTRRKDPETPSQDERRGRETFHRVRVTKQQEKEAPPPNTMPMTKRPSQALWNGNNKTDIKTTDHAPSPESRVRSSMAQEPRRPTHQEQDLSPTKAPTARASQAKWNKGKNEKIVRDQACQESGRSRYGRHMGSPVIA